MAHRAAKQGCFSLGPSKRLHCTRHYRYEILRTKDRLDGVRSRTERALQFVAYLIHLSQYVCSRDDDRGRARSSRQRLPEPAGWHQARKPRSIGGIDQ